MADIGDEVGLPADMGSPEDDHGSKQDSSRDEDQRDSKENQATPKGKHKLVHGASQGLEGAGNGKAFGHSASYFEEQRKAAAAGKELEKINAIKNHLKAAAFDSVTQGANWGKMFGKYDRDGSGEITFDEFNKAIRKDAKVTESTCSEKDLRTLFEHVDEDGSGSVNYEKEFVPWLEERTAGEQTGTKQRYRTDSRKDVLAEKARKKTLNQKKKTMDESKLVVQMARKGLKAAAYSSGGVNWKKLFGYYDRDNSGEITFEEFRNAIRKDAKIPTGVLSEKQLRVLFEFLDKDGGGTVNYETEFLPFVEAADQSEIEEQWHRFKSRSSSRPILKPDSDSRASSPDTGDTSPGYSSRDVDLSRQIDQLSSLVRKQSKVISRMQAEQQTDLQRFRHEQNALCSLLQTTGMVPAHDMQQEFQRLPLGRNVEDNSASPGFVNTPGSRPSSAPSPGKTLSRSPFSFEADGDDLFELCLPLLQKGTASRGREKRLRKIFTALSNGAKPDVWKGPGAPLLAAVEAGAEDLAMLLMRFSACVNIRSEQGVSALHLASFHGNVDLCIEIMNRHADPNTPDCFQQTPLYFTPNRQICELLFQRHADISILNTIGQSAFHLAAKAGYGDVLLWFAHHLPRGVIELRDTNGFTAQDYAEQANVAPYILKKMHVWEPSCDKEHRINLKPKDVDDWDLIEAPTTEQQSQIRLKLKAASYWRGGVDWDELFASYDPRGTGEIPYAVFHEALRDGAHISPSMLPDSQLEALFRLMDADGGGTINYEEEFLPWLDPPEHPKEEEEEDTIKKLTISKAMIAEVKKRLKAAAYSNGVVSWKALFRYYDKDNSGEINFQEFKSAIRKSARIPKRMIPDDTLLALFEYLDKDGGGTVEYESEFLTWLDPEGTIGDVANVDGRKADKKFEILKQQEIKAQFDDAVAQTKRRLIIAATDDGQVNIRKMWRTYDKKDTGQASFEDFKNMIRRHGKVKPQMLTDAAIETLFKAVDKNRDGKLDYESEFLVWLGIELGVDEPGEKSFSVAAAQRQRARAARMLVEEKMSEIKERLFTAAYENGVVNFAKLFRHYDRDDTGNLDIDEFTLCIRKKARMSPQMLSDEAVKALFEYVDANEDGTINYETEFLPWLQVELGQDAGKSEQELAAGVKAASKKKQQAAKRELNQNIRDIFAKLKACAFDNSLGGANWEKLFRTYDKDNSGEIEYEEFQQMIRNKARIKVQDVSDAALASLFKYIDADSSGSVDYMEEFMPWLEAEEENQAAMGPTRSRQRSLKYSPRRSTSDIKKYESTVSLPSKNLSKKSLASPSAKKSLKPSS